MALPLIAVVALALLLQHRWRSALVWLLATGGTLALMLVLKVGVAACGWRAPALGPGGLDLHSASGHAATAAVISGGLVVLLAPGRRRTALAVSLLATLLIGATRLALGVHSPSEVLLGGAVGVFGTYALSRLLRPAPFRVAPVLAAALLAVVVFHGNRLPAETVIQGRGAREVRRLLPSCVPPGSEAAVPTIESGERDAGSIRHRHGTFVAER